MIWILIVGLGLIAGSFISALIDRLWNREGFFWTRSRCDHCRRPLAAWQLVPVFSWLCQLGRCGHCRQTISCFYPLLELVTAGLFALSYWQWPAFASGGWPLAIFSLWLLIVILFILLSLYDLKEFILPDKLILPLAILSLIFSSTIIILYSPEAFFIQTFFQLAVSCLLGGGLFALIYFISGRQWIGFGDVKLGLVLGILLLDWRLTLMMIFLASFLGSLTTLTWGRIKKGGFNLKQVLPFGPFLMAATFLVFIFGNHFLEIWYWLFS